MKVTVTIEVEHTLLPRLAELLEDKPAATKKGRKREVEETPVAIADPMPAVEEPVPTPKPGPGSKEITDAEIRTEAAKLLRAGKQPELKALLDKYGVNRATSVVQSQRASFMQDLEALNG